MARLSPQFLSTGFLETDLSRHPKLALLDWSASGLQGGTCHALTPVLANPRVTGVPPLCLEFLCRCWQSRHSSTPPVFIDKLFLTPTFDCKGWLNIYGI